MTLSDRATLLALAGVLAYAAFEWGGVLRTNQYQYLLVLGLLAVVVSLGRARGERAPLPGRMVCWALALFPAYVLLQVVPLPVPLVRVLSPARAEGVAALERIGAQVNFAALRVCDFFELRLRCSHNQLPSCSHPSGWVEGDGIRSERGDRFFVTALAFSSSPDGLRGSLGQQHRGEVHHVVGQSTPECNAAGFGQPSDRNAT